MTVPVIHPLPLTIDLETKPILKKLASASAALAELKGVSGSIPHQDILVNTLSLQEAKDSSAIENIITTHDDLFQSDAIAREFTSPAAKEVHNYATALKIGFEKVKQSGLLTNNHILEIHAALEENSAGFRKLPGTSLKNDQTGEIIYTPPQEAEQIQSLMNNLEQFINNDDLWDWNPLIKMAVIHHQFESIHPFYDGNGRTGRIINILYLVKNGLLTMPVLYLSRFINQNKADYYRLLQSVRTDGTWEEWVLYMLEGVEQTANQTTLLVGSIRDLMMKIKHQMRNETNIYTQDLLNLIFCHPYTKIDSLMREMQVTRITATRYLEILTDKGIMHKIKLGRSNYYINTSLFHLLATGHPSPDHRS